MVAVPGATGVTVPSAATVATPVLLDVHSVVNPVTRLWFSSSTVTVGAVVIVSPIHMARDEIGALLLPSVMVTVPREVVFSGR